MQLQGMVVDLKDLWPRLGDLGLAFGYALIVLLITWRLAILVQRLIRKSFSKAKMDVNIAFLVARLGKWSIWLAGILIVMGIFGVGWAAIGAAVGVLGIAAGLAMQDVLKNFIAGLYLLAERPFRIGDRIKIKDFSGVVEDVKIRVTLLRTDDGSRVIIPNATIFVEIVVNHAKVPVETGTGGTY